MYGAPFYYKMHILYLKFDILISQIRFYDMKKMDLVISKNYNDFAIWKKKSILWYNQIAAILWHLIFESW